MSDVIRRHLDAIAASVALLGAQIEAAKHALGEPVTAIGVPDECRGVDEARCARLSPEAGTNLMGGVMVCMGCQERLTPH